MECEVNRLSNEVRNLESELSKGVNTPYLKHVLLQFIFSSDIQVQERLLNVISTILGFTQEENMKIREHRAPRGMLNKILNWP